MYNSRAIVDVGYVTTFTSKCVNFYTQQCKPTHSFYANAHLYQQSEQPFKKQSISQLCVKIHETPSFSFELCISRTNVSFHLLFILLIVLLLSFGFFLVYPFLPPYRLLFSSSLLCVLLIPSFFLSLFFLFIPVLSLLLSHTQVFFLIFLHSLLSFSFPLYSLFLLYYHMVFRIYVFVSRNFDLHFTLSIFIYSFLSFIHFSSCSLQIFLNSFLTSIFLPAFFHYTLPLPSPLTSALNKSTNLTGKQ